MPRRRQAPVVGDVRAALARAAEWVETPEFATDAADLRSYRVSHEAIRLLFERLDLRDRMAVLAAANATYGWMPTILDAVDLDAITGHSAELENLRAAGAPEDAIALAGAWEPSARARLFTAVNNSLVGSSKFLHFLNPAAVPIWDSRVAHTFGGRVGAWDDYLVYWRALARAAADGVRPPARFMDFLNQEIEGSPPRPDASDIRALEFMLFHYGRWLMEQDRARKRAPGGADGGTRTHTPEGSGF